MNNEKRTRIAAERRNHEKRLYELRSEFAPSKQIDDEYQQHQQRLGEILGDEEEGIVGTMCGRTA